MTDCIVYVSAAAADAVTEGKPVSPPIAASVSTPSVQVDAERNVDEVIQPKKAAMSTKSGKFSLQSQCTFDRTVHF